MKNAIYSTTFIVVCLGAIQWGMVGIGGFVGKNFNVITVLTRGNSAIEYGVYTFVGLAGLLYIWFST
jgi:uncharacterized membrane protein YuzA (DUF378 family)